MGNSSSSQSEGKESRQQRPQLRTQSSAASTATLKSQQTDSSNTSQQQQQQQQQPSSYSSSTSSSRRSQSPSDSLSHKSSGGFLKEPFSRERSDRRRKSIELPDLDPSLHFTSSQLQPASGLKGSLLPPEATKPTEPEPEILLASHAHEVLQAQQSHSSSASSTPGASSTAVGGKPPQTAGSSDSASTITSVPNTVGSDKQIQGTSAASASAAAAAAAASGGSLLPPLHPPSETIVAPAVPVHVAIPLGVGASATAASIIGSPWASGHNSPATSPPVTEDHHQQPIFASLNTEAMNVASSSASGSSTSEASTVSPAPPPPSIPPHSSTVTTSNGSPLPVVAPLATLTALGNPAAAEAVKAATIDLGAGPDGVPTLLTWTPGEGEGKEGMLHTDDSLSSGAPIKVFVTGTFAKGWTTKIELRKKESQPDFSALVNLPPGPHSLKFIVDEQWKTSKNLPSATDPEGNLVNYLQVTKSSILPATAGPGAPGSLTADEERWMKEEAQWSTSIPEPLLAFGEATESEDATFEAHEEHNRKLVEQGMDPLPPPNDQELPSHIMSKNFAPPPQLPAQLNRGVLNFAVAQSVGSGDDNSILPKPDHTVIDHLAASPISKGLLSVGVTKRYRRKFVTTVLYKPVPIS